MKIDGENRHKQYRVAVTIGTYASTFWQVQVAAILPVIVLLLLLLLLMMLLLMMMMAMCSVNVEILENMRNLRDARVRSSRYASRRAPVEPPAGNFWRRGIQWHLYR